MNHLTAREQDVFKGIAYGNTNSKIAGSLAITEKTVKNIAHSLFIKLNVSNRVQAALIFHGIEFSKD